MTKEKELYIKDKKIIMALVSDTTRFFYVMYIVSVLCFGSCIFLQFVSENDSAVMLILMGTYLMILYFIFAVLGTSPNVKLTSSSSREGVNGSPLQIDTLSCIPIRKVNVLLYQYSVWKKSSFLVFTAVVGTTIAALMGNSEHLCYIYIFLAVSYLGLTILYLSAFSVVFHNRILNKITFVLTGVFYAILMISILAASILIEHMKDFYEPSNIFICGALTFAVIYQLAAALIFRQCILKRANNGWYD